MKLLWVTQTKPNKLLSHYFNSLRTEVQRLIPTTIINFQQDLLPTPQEINNKYDLVYTDAYIFNYSNWSKITLPKVFFLNDLHGQYIHNAIQYYISQKFDAVTTTYLTPLHHFHPTLKNYVKIIWMPFCVDSKIFNNYYLPKIYKCIQTGALTSNYYPLRYQIHQELQKFPGYQLIPHPGYHLKTNIIWPVEKDYAKLFNQSICSISCTSNLNYVVLKTFEIPASYSILCSNFINEMEELGFKPSYNMYELLSTSSITKQLNNLLYDQDMVNELTTNGYKLIHSRHTTSIRAKELITELKKLI